MYSIVTKVTPITLFASTFSLLSIMTSIFACISSSVFLRNETILVIKIDVLSNELANMTYDKFMTIKVSRRKISSEIAKIIDMDSRLIELLRPIQTKNGVLLTFYIRSDTSQSGRAMDLIRQEIQNGHLAQV